MISLKKLVLRSTLGLLIAILLFTGLFIVPSLTNTIMPWDRGNAVETTLLWGGLAELPEDTKDISVQTRGNHVYQNFYSWVQ